MSPVPRPDLIRHREFDANIIFTGKCGEKCLLPSKLFPNTFNEFNFMSNYLAFCLPISDPSLRECFLAFKYSPFEKRFCVSRFGKHKVIYVYSFPQKNAA